MILVLTGTHEAREMIHLLLKNQYDVQVLVQSEYGKNLALADGLADLVEVLDETSLDNSVLTGSYQAIIDATQPFPNVATDRAYQYCQQQRIPYIRLTRNETLTDSHPLIIPAQDWEEAAILAAQHGPTIFLTTGSHNLEMFMKCNRNRNRLVVRVLPDHRVIKKCQDMGISPRDIIALQGPYSKEFNRSMFKAYRASCIVTRDGGHKGGTDTKLAAAISLGIPVILIKRQPVETRHPVSSPKEALELLRRLGI